MTAATPPTQSPSAYPHPSAVVLGVCGALTGVLSGMFGVGGGVVLVPVLALWLRFPQRLAAGTSVAAILPAAIVGGVSYALHGHVDWLAAAALTVGVVAGAQLGSFLLAKLSTTLLRWLFIGFLVVTTTTLWLVVPSRESEIAVSIVTVLLLLGTGLFTGVLSGLLGVGGGIVVVPVLMFFFGASDLVAKGTSLLMLIPGSLSATIGNIRRRNVDVRAAVWLGIAASLASPLGTLIAAVLDPFWSNAAFSVLLAVVAVQLLVQALRERRGGGR